MNTALPELLSCCYFSKDILFLHDIPRVILKMKVDFNDARPAGVSLLIGVSLRGAVYTVTW